MTDWNNVSSVSLISTFLFSNTQHYKLDKYCTSDYIFNIFFYKLRGSTHSYKESGKWSDIQPSMVTHTQNSCSAFDPSKVHTHSCEHTPGAVGSHLCCGPRGAFGGSVLAQGHLSRGIEGGESAVHSPPYNSCRPETWTRNLCITSLTL